MSATYSRSKELNHALNLVEPLLSIDLAVRVAVLRNTFAHPAQVREDPEVGRLKGDSSQDLQLRLLPGRGLFWELRGVGSRAW